MEKLRTLLEEDTAFKRLFPEGRNLVPGKKAINPTDGRLVAAESAARANTPENLASFFENGNHNHGILMKWQFGTGHVVSVITPSAPYTELGLMICAGNPKEVRAKDYSTQTIYDLPEEVQRKYWEATLATLLVYGELTTDDGRCITVATENTTPVTSKKYRTSRTLLIPHSQIGHFELDRIQEGRIVIPSLALEQRILRNKAAGEFVGKVYQDMCRQDGFMQMGFIVPLQLRKVEPYGYTFVFGADNIMAEIDMFQRVMQCHHDSYSKQAEIIERQAYLNKNRARIIPQPSYRTYICFDGGLLKVIISPEFVSHAGVTEAAGLETVRSETIEPKYNPEEINSFRESAKERVLKKLGY